MFCMEFKKMALAALVLAVPLGTSQAQEAEAEATGAVETPTAPEPREGRTLNDLGLDLEAARRAADMGDRTQAESLARALVGEAEGRRFLLAGTNRGRPVLADELKKAGAHRASP